MGPVKIKKPEGKEEREGKKIKLNAHSHSFECVICNFQCKTELPPPPPHLQTIYLSSFAHLCQPTLRGRKWIHGDVEGTDNVSVEIPGSAAGDGRNTQVSIKDNPAPALTQMALICDVKRDGETLYSK